MDFPGLKVTTCEQHVNKKWLKVIKKNNTPSGLSFDPRVLRWNLSSGAAAINLAVLFGAKRIVLLGFDMKKVEVDGKERENWHDDYERNPNPKRNPYQRFLAPFPGIAESAKRHHIQIVNATLGSALMVFPIVDPEDVL